ncbi:MAG TPA: hypothetical protein EYO33_14935 [Phycisphaerales bacterium]|nr:hypothetical protein [Phycisphaerales bacterium]
MPIGTVLIWILLLVNGAWAQTRVLVTYDSVDHHTERVAKWIAEGVEQQPDVVLRLQRVQETSHLDLQWADVILVGSPVYNTGPSQAVGKFLAEWPFEGSPLKNRVGGAFVSCQGNNAGSENTLFTIIKTMLMYRMYIVGGEDWRSGFGVAYIQDGSNQQTLGFLEKQAKGLAKRACDLGKATSATRTRSDF